ncbi:MAG: acetylornithine/succinylornithine family transaminase [Clostridia bacterium]|nr:acetylornithine/succinylornithine family transaminase [Clostridia bacterium]
MNICEIDNLYVEHTYNRFPLTIVSGSGSTVTDEAGRTYIDFGSGIATNSFGVADPVWQQAITEQIGKVQHTSNLYYSEPCAVLAQKLCERTGLKKVFFCNSGAEANEGALKIARKYAADRGNTAPVIVTLKNSFHGRTIATLTATGQDGYHQHFGPFPAGFVYAEANNVADTLEKLAGENVCAILMEAVQGEGGINVLEDDYVKAVADYCAENDKLLMFDEVQTGNGRCGTLYAYMHYGVKPDVVSTAKGLAGGLPFGAVLIGEKAEGVLVAGTHGSTFGGNPVCAAAANSVVDRLTEELFAEIRAKYAYFCETMSGAAGVAEITGRGFMLGVLPTEKSAADVVRECREQGLLVLTAKNKVRLLPALNIGWDEWKQGLEILKGVLAK